MLDAAGSWVWLSGGRWCLRAAVCCLALLMTACGVADAPVSDAVISTPSAASGAALSPTHEATPTFIAGTVTPAVPTPLEPTPTFDPSAPATPDPADPISMIVEPAMAADPPPPESYDLEGNLVVLGVVREVLPARWTTTDGRRPENPWVTMPDVYSIVTPVRLQLSTPPIVNRTGVDVDGGEIIVLLQRGTVGLDSFEYGVSWSRLAVGERVVLVLGTDGYGAGGRGLLETEHGLAWWVAGKWQILADDRVVAGWFTGAATAPIDTLDDLIDVFRASEARQFPEAVTPTAEAGGTAPP